LAIRSSKTIFLWLACAAVLAAGLTVTLYRGSPDPMGCLQNSVKGAALTDFAKSLESSGGIGRLAGFSCRGFAGLIQSQRARDNLSLQLTQAWIGNSDFRYGLYQAHVERALGESVDEKALRPILESLDQLMRDENAARSCPETSAGKVPDYEGLRAPLISAMLLRSPLPRHEGEAGKVARDLSTILQFASQLPRFPKSSCAEAPRYFVAMNAFVSGLHPLAKDCKPRLEGTDVLLDCAPAQGTERK
jgi:hypothetical protein